MLDSDVVVRAKVIDVSQKPAQDPKAYSVLDVWRTITLDVQETLKGEHEKRLIFAAYGHPTRNVFEQLKESELEFLCCLVIGDRSSHYKEQGKESDRPPPKILQTHQTDPCVWEKSLIRLGPPSGDSARIAPPIYTADLKLLKDPVEVLKAARKSAADSIKGVRMKPSHRCI
jgi:hypothetical protein